MTRASFAGSRSQSILKAPHWRMTTSAWVFSRRNPKRSRSMTRLSSIHFFTSPLGSKSSALTNTKLCRYNQYGHTQHKQKGLHCRCCWALLHWHLSIFHFRKGLPSLFWYVFLMNKLCCWYALLAHDTISIYIYVVLLAEDGAA